MRKYRDAGLLILSVLCSSTAHAQNGLTPSDLAPFVGSWTLDPTRSGASDRERRIITLGAGWVRVELHRPGDAHPPALIYNLDGSPNVNPFGPGTAITEMLRDQDAIVTVTVFTVNERPVTVRERLQITTTGEMTAAVVVRVEHGYQGVLPPLEKAAPNVAETSKYFTKTP
jgi:hypothetical protein